MLEWEPAARGQVQGEGGSKQVVAFSMINDVLNKKVNMIRFILICIRGWLVMQVWNNQC